MNRIDRGIGLEHGRFVHLTLCLQANFDRDLPNAQRGLDCIVDRYVGMVDQHPEAFADDSRRLTAIRIFGTLQHQYQHFVGRMR